MDLIHKYNEWIEQVENFFINPPSIDLDIDTIDKIVKLYYIHSQIDYGTKRKNVNNFKLKYLDLPTLDPDQKLCSMLQWDLLSDTISSNWLDKQTLIKFINKANPKYFETVFGLIKSEKISFNLDDVKLLVKDFFSYVGSHLINRPNKRTDTDFLQRSNVKVNSLESFFVNGIMGLDPSPDNSQIISGLIKGLGWMGGTGDLEFAPSGRVKKFSGDLIHQIYPYYSENFLTPFVSARTNVGIVTNNTSCNFYPYVEYMNYAKKISCSELSIEFPHMCWVWPEYIEIEYIGSRSNLDNNKPTITARPGYDYLLESFRSITSQLKSVSEPSYNSSLKQIYKIDFTQEEKSCPCVYIRINIPNYEKILGIKVFGQALVLI